VVLLKHFLYNILIRDCAKLLYGFILRYFFLILSFSFFLNKILGKLYHHDIFDINKFILIQNLKSPSLNSRIEDLNQ